MTVKSLVAALVGAMALSACGTVSGSGSPAMHDIRGVVLATPGCPVQRLDSPCPALRVVGAVVVARRNGVTAGQARSGQDGSFTLAVAAGTYTLTAVATGGYRSTATKSVLVSGSAQVRVLLTLDSGIR